MEEKVIREIVAQAVKAYWEKPLNINREDYVMEIPVEASARHVHLSREDLETLFGDNYELNVKKSISQPGQFLSEERVSLIGPKGRMDNVAVLGPVRDRTQVELSFTDCRSLGINAPVRMSGELEEAADIYIMANGIVTEARSSAIVAKNHIHMPPEDAGKYRLKNGEQVNVRVNSSRPIVFEGVTVRVSEDARPAFHIDYDEANACGYKQGATGVISAAGINRSGGSCRQWEGTYGKPEPGEVFKGKLLSENEIYKAYKKGVKKIEVGKETVVTPLARDYAGEKKVDIICIKER
ncbi:MAG TPA: phosphate propanoyltransferase [Candidatus Copromorpha excrementigallinarum]|uniref:Phosphate propanoyltransferase n=1 Tax=Candidatus Allocopromorpha excrementigallinarum TaxID=2840742 RepID=A0A9D1L7E3_9FIRM|nr:phosphate propanoyltransferase [Candidatus Copromorpha excrementigallinarum]